MTIPGINLYSASAILSEIDDVSRFPTKEKLAAYAGLVPRQDQSGNRDIKGHITKHGPSMLRFILVTAAHVAIRYSKKMKAKYLSIVRRLGNLVTSSISDNMTDAEYRFIPGIVISNFREAFPSHATAIARESPTVLVPKAIVRFCLVLL